MKNEQSMFYKMCTYNLHCKYDEHAALSLQRESIEHNISGVYDEENHYVDESPINTPPQEIIEDATHPGLDIARRIIIK